MIIMRATELRIGNLVKDINGAIFKIRQENLCDFANGFIKVEPVPLTEELLLTFGFKNNRLGLFDCVKVGDDIGYHIYFIGKHLKEVQYVHQLQNLYFALIGDELTIN